MARSILYTIVFLSIVVIGYQVAVDEPARATLHELPVLDETTTTTTPTPADICVAAEPAQVVVFGDSIVTGRIIGRFDYEFRKRGYETTVVSEGGATTREVAQMVAANRKAVRAADVVVFNAGANDIDPGMARPMRRAVKRIRKLAPDALIIWVPVASVKHLDSYILNNTLIHRAARRHRFTVAPWWEAVFADGQPSEGLRESGTHERYLGSDGLHLTNAGQDALVRTIVPLLPEQC